MPIKAIKRFDLHWQIIGAMVLGTAFGALIYTQVPESGIAEGSWISNVEFTMKLIADIFLRLLKMLVVPLVFASIICGIIGIGAAKDVGRLGLKTGLYYFITTTFAVLTGLFFANVIAPGNRLTEETRMKIMELSGPVKDVAEPDSLWSVLTRIIPKNPFESFANFDMISVIFFAIIFGVFAASASKTHRETLSNFFNAANEVMMNMADWVISLAPIGIFCLVSKLIIQTGLGIFITLAWYVLAVFLALAFHFFVTLPMIIKFKTGKSPLAYFKAMAPALLTGFSTASSAATLSVTMKCAHKNVGVSNKVSSFTLPMGATVNMDGTALYECVAVIFIAQVYSHSLTAADQFTIVLTAILASVGAAAIPHAGLVMMVIILGAVGLPLEATGMIWAVDRVLDMCRTATNVWSDSVGAGVIAHSEGEDILPNAT